jgi:transcriptional regulator with XRE-family HTH domain
MTFYELFEIALREKHMSTADICAKTGLYPSYFSKLKNGKFKDVTWEKALIIIHALGMTPDEFNALSDKVSE